MEMRRIDLPFRVVRPTLALGSQAKNTVCFAVDNRAYLSPVYKNLNNPQDFLGFEEAVKYFLRKKPRIIACDLHPEYASTKYAKSALASYHLMPIQHHHSHIASCMLEHGLQRQRVIGISFDGTGLGSDGKLWGAEFFCPCNYKDFQRKAYLREVPLIGGERAILEPWRVTAAWLDILLKDRLCDTGLDFIKGIDKKKWRILKNMRLAGFNSPLASSMGRLFDAVGSLVLRRYTAQEEAELAIALEETAAGYRSRAKGYEFTVHKKNGQYILDPLSVFRGIILDLRAKAAPDKIAYRFHLAVAGMIKMMCSILREESGINKVVLSGGVFQNKLLLKNSLDLLYKDGFVALAHRRFSCNDSSISLGQVAVASPRS